MKKDLLEILEEEELIVNKRKHLEEIQTNEYLEQEIGECLTLENELKNSKNKIIDSIMEEETLRHYDLENAKVIVKK